MQTVLYGIDNNRDAIKENIETSSYDLNDRISGEIGILIGKIYSQKQRAVEESISNQVLPQVQNVLKDLQTGDELVPVVKKRDRKALALTNYGQIAKTVRT